MSIDFKQYDVHSPCYRQAWDLREQILRTPLGLSLTSKDRDSDKGCWHFGLFKDSQIVATVTIELPANKISRPQQVKLRQMVVSPDFQNQGLGQQLIEKTEQALRDKSVVKISLAARLPAVGFYQKLGFKSQGPVYHHLRIDHQDMCKMLS